VTSQAEFNAAVLSTLEDIFYAISKAREGLTWPASELCGYHLNDASENLARLILLTKED
jgi:hypothetical protein